MSSLSAPPSLRTLRTRPPPSSVTDPTRSRRAVRAQGRVALPVCDLCSPVRPPRLCQGSPLPHISFPRAGAPLRSPCPRIYAGPVPLCPAVCCWPLCATVCGKPLPSALSKLPTGGRQSGRSEGFPGLQAFACVRWVVGALGSIHLGDSFADCTPHFALTLSISRMPPSPHCHGQPSNPQGTPSDPATLLSISLPLSPPVLPVSLTKSWRPCVSLLVSPKVPCVRLLVSPKVDCKLPEDYVPLLSLSAPHTQTSRALHTVSSEGVFVELISINSVFN